MSVNYTYVLQVGSSQTCIYRPMMGETGAPQQLILWSPTMWKLQLLHVHKPSKMELWHPLFRPYPYLELNNTMYPVKSFLSTPYSISFSVFSSTFKRFFLTDGPIMTIASTCDRKSYKEGGSEVNNFS